MGRRGFWLVRGSKYTAAGMGICWVFVGAIRGRQDALVRAANPRRLTFSGIRRRGQWTWGLLLRRLNPTVEKTVSKVGLRFDLPQMDPRKKPRGWRLWVLIRQSRRSCINRSPPKAALHPASLWRASIGHALKPALIPHSRPALRADLCPTCSARSETSVSGRTTRALCGKSRSASAAGRTVEEVATLIRHAMRRGLVVNPYVRGHRIGRGGRCRNRPRTADPFAGRMNKLRAGVPWNENVLVAEAGMILSDVPKPPPKPADRLFPLDARSAGFCPHRGIWRTNAGGTRRAALWQRPRSVSGLEGGAARGQIWNGPDPTAQEQQPATACVICCRGRRAPLASSQPPR